MTLASDNLKLLKLGKLYEVILPLDLWTSRERLSAKSYTPGQYLLLSEYRFDEEDKIRANKVAQLFFLDPDGILVEGWFSISRIHQWIKPS